MCSHCPAISIITSTCNDSAAPACLKTPTQASVLPRMESRICKIPTSLSCRPHLTSTPPKTEVQRSDSPSYKHNLRVKTAPALHIHLFPSAQIALQIPAFAHILRRPRSHVWRVRALPRAFTNLSLEVARSSSSPSSQSSFM